MQSPDQDFRYVIGAGLQHRWLTVHPKVHGTERPHERDQTGSKQLYWGRISREQSPPTSAQTRRRQDLRGQESGCQMYVCTRVAMHIHRRRRHLYMLSDIS